MVACNPWLSNSVSVTRRPSFFCIDFPILFPLTTFSPYWDWTPGLILAKHSTTELYICSVSKSAPSFLHICHPNKTFPISSGDQIRILMLAESSPQTPDFSFYTDTRLIGGRAYFHDSILIQSPLSRSYLRENSQSQSSTRSSRITFEFWREHSSVHTLTMIGCTRRVFMWTLAITCVKHTELLPPGLWIEFNKHWV